MKQITVIVKPFVAERVLQVIARHPVQACLVDEVKGYGRQKGYLDRYQGSEYSLTFLPKVEISCWIDNHSSELLLEELTETARTGRMGDGKVFVQNTVGPDAIEF